MATNQVLPYTRSLQAVCSQPTTPASGDPVLVGQIPGVALIAEATDGETTIALDGVFTLTAKGETNADAGSAIAVGDILYYDAADTPVINKDTTGVRFGYALEGVGSGVTAAIRVMVGY